MIADLGDHDQSSGTDHGPQVTSIDLASEHPYHSVSCGPVKHRFQSLAYT